MTTLWWRRWGRLGLAGAGTLLLVACDSSMIRPDAPKEVELTSAPPGAVVKVSGKEIGTTPLRVRPGDVFPSGIKNWGYQYYGTLEFSKPGCRPVRIEIDDAVAKKNHHVELQCEQGAGATRGAEETAPAPSVSPDGADVAARLRRVEALHNEGVLTDEEYRAVRRRILDQL